jgi:hypothetical protein
MYTKIKTTERIVVPFTDGVKSLSVVTDLKKAYETEGKQLLLISRKHQFYRSLMKLGSTCVKWMS